MCLCQSQKLPLLIQTAKKEAKIQNKVNVLSKSEIKNGEKRKYVNTKINGHTLKFLLVTGSDISIVNEVWNGK